MFAVFCTCCTGLLGYFKHGIAAAIQRYGNCCPQCENTFHENRAEGLRQRQAHEAWSDAQETEITVTKGTKADGTPNEVGHCFAEYPLINGDFRSAPSELIEKREAWIAFCRGFKATAPQGQTVELD